MEHDRIAFFIAPWKPYFGDSGQIKGLSGSGGSHDEPLKDDTGCWIEFASFEDAVAAAIERGYDKGDVCEFKVCRLVPAGGE